MNVPGSCLGGCSSHDAFSCLLFIAEISRVHVCVETLSSKSLSRFSGEIDGLHSRRRVYVYSQASCGCTHPHARMLSLKQGEWSVEEERALLDKYAELGPKVCRSPLWQYPPPPCFTGCRQADGLPERHTDRLSHPPISSTIYGVRFLCVMMMTTLSIGLKQPRPTTRRSPSPLASPPSQPLTSLRAPASFRVIFVRTRF